MPKRSLGNGASCASWRLNAASSSSASTVHGFCYSPCLRAGRRVLEWTVFAKSTFKDTRCFRTVSLLNALFFTIGWLGRWLADVFEISRCSVCRMQRLLSVLSLLKRYLHVAHRNGLLSLVAVVDRFLLLRYRMVSVSTVSRGHSLLDAKSGVICRNSVWAEPFAVAG